MAFTASTSRVVAGRPDLVKRRPVSHRPEHAFDCELVSDVDDCQPEGRLGATQVREVADELLVGVEALTIGDVTAGVERPDFGIASCVEDVVALCEADVGRGALDWMKDGVPI